jgi:hypothetical protein
VGAVGVDIELVSKLKLKLIVDEVTVPVAVAGAAAITDKPVAISKVAVAIEINFLIMM